MCEVLVPRRGHPTVKEDKNVFFGSVQKLMKSGRLHFWRSLCNPICTDLQYELEGKIWNLRSCLCIFWIFTPDERGDWVSNPMDVHTLTSSIIQGQVTSRACLI